MHYPYENHIRESPVKENGKTMTKKTAPNVCSFLLVVFGVVLPGVAPAEADTAIYNLTIDNTWSEVTHPGRVAPTDAHFSWLGGGTHSDQVSFWNVGELASPGMVEMAETGVINKFVGEVSVESLKRNAFGPVAWRHWFCPVATTNKSCGELSVEFEMDSAFPLVTLVTMLGPSPDWFVGTNGLPLYEEGAWLQEVVFDLYPYDGGTRSANQWPLGGPRNDPAEAISVITEESGHLVGPAKMGTMTFTLIWKTAVESSTWAEAKAIPR